MAFEVTKDSIIGDILDYDNTVADIFFGMGMHCVGCPSARGESIGEACQVHGVDCDKIVAELRTRLS